MVAMIGVIFILACSKDTREDVLREHTPFPSEMKIRPLHMGLAHAQSVPLVGMALAPVHATVSLIQATLGTTAAFLCAIPGGIAYPFCNSVSSKCFQASTVCLQVAKDSCSPLGFTFLNFVTCTTYGWNKTWKNPYGCCRSSCCV